MTPRSTLLGTALVAAALTLGATTSFAQAAGGRGAEMKKKFEAADANGDGKLSKDEVKGKFPVIEKHFDEIDTTHSGAISMKEVAVWMRAQKAAKP